MIHRVSAVSPVCWRSLRMYALACALMLPMAACDESPRDAYSRGFNDGAESARATADTAREEGHRAGFKEGFETARPPSGITPPKGAWLTASIVAMILGMVKIILSFVIFILILIVRSASWPERAAKIIATSLAVILVFWLSNSLTLGFSRSVNDIILAPASTTALGKLGTGVLAAIIMWALLWVLDTLASASRGHAYLQTGYVLVSTSVVTILIPIFLSLEDVPNIFGYRFFDLILGVVVGGVCWIVQRLLIEAEKRQRRRVAQARPVVNNPEMKQSPMRSQRRLGG